MNTSFESHKGWLASPNNSSNTQSLKIPLDENYRSTDTRFFKVFPQRVLKYSDFSNFCTLKWKSTTLFIEAYLEIRSRILKVKSQPLQKIMYIVAILIWQFFKTATFYDIIW